MNTHLYLRSASQPLIPATRLQPQIRPGRRQPRSFSHRPHAGKRPTLFDSTALRSPHSRSPFQSRRPGADSRPPPTTRVSSLSGEDIAQPDLLSTSTCRLSRIHWRGLPDRRDRRKGASRPYPSIPTCPKIHIRRPNAAPVMLNPYDEAGSGASQDLQPSSSASE